jgi:hypothetical protein
MTRMNLGIAAALFKKERINKTRIVTRCLQNATHSLKKTNYYEK